MTTADVEAYAIALPGREGGGERGGRTAGVSREDIRAFTPVFAGYA
jgi:hypothetical protein